MRTHPYTEKTWAAIKILHRYANPEVKPFWGGPYLMEFDPEYPDRIFNGLNAVSYQNVPETMEVLKTYPASNRGEDEEQTYVQFWREFWIPKPTVQMGTGWMGPDGLFFTAPYNSHATLEKHLYALYYNLYADQNEILLTKGWLKIFDTGYLNFHQLFHGDGTLYITAEQKRGLEMLIENSDDHNVKERLGYYLRDCQIVANTLDKSLMVGNTEVKMKGNGNIVDVPIPHRNSKKNKEHQSLRKNERKSARQQGKKATA
jgi:hypothetical protein